MNIDIKDVFKDKNIVWLILLGLIILLLLGAGFLGVLKYQDQKSVLANEQFLLDQNLQRVVKLQHLAANEKQTIETAMEIRQMLPDNVNQGEIFTRIQSLCEEYNVNIKQITFQDVQTRGVAQYLPVNMDLSGSYRNIMSLLDLFSYEKRMILLDSLRVNRSEGTLDVSIVAAAFFENPALVAQPAAASSSSEPADGTAAADATE